MTIRLYDQSRSTVLLTTDWTADAHQFLRDSGADWLPIVYDHGDTGWKTGWAGRLILNTDNTVSMYPERDFLPCMLQPNNPLLDRRDPKE